MTTSSLPELTQPTTTHFDQKVFLLAEDSKNEVFLVKRAFKTAGVINPLHVVPDGQAAQNYLGGIGSYADRSRHPLPDVALLDLNMPHRNGFEVLSWLRSQTAFHSLIVVVLTSSNSSADADRAYQLGANFYLTKPGQYEALVQMIHCLRDWLRSYHFPSSHR